MNGAAISWGSKKQTIVAHSSTEAEYIAITHAAREAMWLRYFFAAIADPIFEPTIVHSDNQGAIALTRNSRYHARTKHINSLPRRKVEYFTELLGLTA